ncbi:MAG: L,D-transpeptidase [Cyanobacteria bacterium J06650_10]
MSYVRKTVFVVTGLISFSGMLGSALPYTAAVRREDVRVRRDIARYSAQLQSFEKQLRSPSLLDLLDSIPERRTTPVQPSSAPVEPIQGDAVTSGDEEEAVVSLLLRLGERRVYVYRGDAVAASYPVAVGRPGWETPIGEFEIFHQLTNPGWTNPITSEVMPPGPNNPLGDRWIAFWTDGNNSIGFHGTPNRESVGEAASHGCIRMYNEDVRELYSMVAVGTPVTVVQ